MWNSATCNDVKMHRDKESNSSLWRMHFLWFLLNLFCDFSYNNIQCAFFRLSVYFCSFAQVFLVKTIYLIKWRQAHNYIVHFLSSMVNTQNMNCLFWLHEMHILISQFIWSLYAYEDTVVILQNNIYVCVLFARIIGCDFAFRQFHDKFKIVLIQLKCLYRWNNHFQ